MKSEHIMDLKEKASKGGKARAANMTAAERKEAAQKAAEGRWGIPKATHAGVVEVGDLELSCAVLEDGRRLLDYASVMKFVGRTGKAKRAEISGNSSSYSQNEETLKNQGIVPEFLSAENLKPFIGEDLRSPTLTYRTIAGRKATGYEAVMLPRICNVYMTANRAGVLTTRQKEIAVRCEVLLPALAATGIVALIDEATGFQEVRDRRALQAIMDRYLRHEFAEWARTFPDEFYKELFRLRGWEWKGMKVNRPQCVAMYTNDLVYERLAPGILQELEQRNPVQRNGRRLSYHHQWMTEGIGHKALEEHIKSVVTLMRASYSWDLFESLIDRSLPKNGMGIQLTIEDLMPECQAA